MKNRRTVYGLILSVAACFIIQSCASTGKLSADSVRLYKENHQKMIDVSTKAIRNLGMEVTKIDESEEGRTRLIFVDQGPRESQGYTRERGELIISDVDTTDAVMIEIRESNRRSSSSIVDAGSMDRDYHDLVFNQIDTILGIDD